MGVEVRLGQPVTALTEGGVQIGQELVPSVTMVWAAGVAASPAAEWLEAEAIRLFAAGRIRIAGRRAVIAAADSESNAGR